MSRKICKVKCHRCGREQWVYDFDRWHFSSCDHIQMRARRDPMVIGDFVLDVIDIESGGFYQIGIHRQQMDLDRLKPGTEILK